MSVAEPLIHVGYHKTGTTWLQRRIFADPSLGFVRAWPKRVIDEAFVTVDPFDFDAQHGAAALSPFLDDAATQGAVTVISHERLSGFDLLGGYDANTIAERLSAAFPAGRILVVIREQRDMMLSMYKQHIKKSGTETPERLWRERSLSERRRPGPRLEVYEYHRLIERYQDLFGRDRVLVLPYERLRGDPLGFVGEICAHVKLPLPQDVPRMSENVGIPGALIAVLRSTNRLLRAMGMVAEFGGPVRNARVAAFRRRAIRCLTPKIPAPLSRPIDRRLRRSIEELAGDRFTQSNTIVQDLTGLDLSGLGYMTAD